MPSRTLVACVAAAAAAQAPNHGASATSNIFELAQTVPDLSTLVTAVVGGQLVATLESPGPFTVFAPTNEAFAALPKATLAHLLEPANIKELDTVLTYHVLPEAVQSKDLKPFQQVKTVQGDKLQIVATGGKVFVNSAQVTAADDEASNGVVHTINKVLLPPAAPTPAPAPANHLWFRGVTCMQFANKFCRCGDVDAASRMPASLFDPSNAAALKEYEDITTELFKYPISSVNLGKLEVGRCKDIGYESSAGGVQGTTWAPPVLMEGICAEKCQCNYSGGGNSTLPGCRDQPDDPKAGQWCSLCGPKYNQAITINLWNGDCRTQDRPQCSSSFPWKCVDKQCVQDQSGFYTKSGCESRC